MVTRHLIGSARDTGSNVALFSGTASPAGHMGNLSQLSLKGLSANNTTGGGYIVVYKTYNKLLSVVKFCVKVDLFCWGFGLLK